MTYTIINVDNTIVKTTESHDEIESLFNPSSEYHQNIADSDKTAEQYFWYPIETETLDYLITTFNTEHCNVFFILNNDHIGLYHSRITLD